MIRLHIVAEGPTEETFVNQVLTPHLARSDVFVDVHCITTKRDRRRHANYRGGLVDYRHLEKDLDLWMRQEQGKPDVWFSTMIDLYAFPKDEHSPYSETIQAMSDPVSKISALERAMYDRLANLNFLPYVQLHEFEALILAAPERLSLLYGEHKSAINDLCDEVKHLEPETINEKPETAPSKRIIKHIPDYAYQKTTAGVLVVEDIGMPLLRERCPHFNQWISRLEQLGIS